MLSTHAIEQIARAAGRRARVASEPRPPDIAFAVQRPDASNAVHDEYRQAIRALQPSSARSFRAVHAGKPFPATEEEAGRIRARLDARVARVRLQIDALEKHERGGKLTEDERVLLAEWMREHPGP